MTQRFWVGETVRVRVAFTDEAGAPMAAVGVTFVARPKGGASVTGTPVSTQTTGAFYADFQLDQPGIWYVRASCTDPTSAVVEDQVEARASNVL